MPDDIKVRDYEYLAIYRLWSDEDRSQEELVSRYPIGFEKHALEELGRMQNSLRKGSKAEIRRITLVRKIEVT